mgnify:CR=1 FL=1
MEQAFFMVYLDGGDSPRVRHATEPFAAAEAQRLVAATGKAAYVLKAVRAFKRWEPKVEEIPLREATP